MPPFHIGVAELFQSTLPLRGATERPFDCWNTDLFQSTLPLRGATFYSIQRTALYENFNPHSPCGERLRQKRGDIRECLISIHTPLAGSDYIR